MADTAVENSGSTQLPPLSAAEFKQYNSMAEHMDYYHNNFRQTWKSLYAECCGGKKMGSKQFIATGLTFSHHLHIHHSIEEQHIFPVLAKKMPAFRKELELLSQHKEILQGLEEFQSYLGDCSVGRREKLDWGEVKTIMDSFGEVLWAHLDDEVRQLGANNMRQYWTIDEMGRMPM